jgi:DNA (cytosine-5)-methyltransferase 1
VTKSPKVDGPSSISLFSGAGGLDLGLERAGFQINLCIEIDDFARRTIAANKHWPIAEPGDIFALDAASIADQSGLDDGDVDLLHGGPPCQPFSKSGLWVSGRTPRMRDPRAKSLEAYLELVEAFRPRVILLENVEGLASGQTHNGLSHLLSELSRINKRRRTRYTPTVHKLSALALDYGVPQRRVRLFVIACRDGAVFDLPPVGLGGWQSLGEPTAWDAIGDLDSEETDSSLELSGRWAGLLPTIPEGSNYLWHTPRGGGTPLFGWRTRYWSFLLKLAKCRPSWTIQASPGPATGPFHWRNRRLSIPELRRIQTFPDDFEFAGGYRSAVHQIGNAVPPALAEFLGRAILRSFFGDRRKINLSLAVKVRGSPPPPEPVLRLPGRFARSLVEPEDHPGVGKGPRSRSLRSMVVLRE